MDCRRAKAIFNNNKSTKTNCLKFGEVLKEIFEGSGRRPKATAVAIVMVVFYFTLLNETDLLH